MTKNTFEELLVRLAEKGISEYYLTPGSNPYYRIDGRLIKEEDAQITTSSYTEAVMNLLLLEREEEKFGHNGSYELAYSIKQVGRFRVRFGRQRSSVAVVIIVKNTVIPELESLPLPAAIKSHMNSENGLLIVCGDKKSRKLTTIAALLKDTAENNTKVITAIEDPIEFLLPHGEGIVNQMEVGIDISDRIQGLNEGISNNSDIIYLSELSSREDIREVFSALEKGFFVIVAMNATGVEAAINHILYGFEDHEQMYLKSLLANHLISIVCEQDVVGVDGSLQPIYEVMLNNIAVQSMFLENKLAQLEQIFEAFPGTGMSSMDNAIIEAVVEGRITKEMALNVARRPGQLMKKLNGVN